MKVYCRHCKHVDWWNTFYRQPICFHPSNIMWLSSAYREIEGYKICHYLEELNSKNDCKNYKKSWYRFWVKDKLK